MTAYCWASGLIEFTRKKDAPQGAIIIASAPGRELRRVVYAVARHGYTKGVLLVPGVPEAKLLGRDPVKALIGFTQNVQRCLNKKPV